MGFIAIVLQLLKGNLPHPLLLNLWTYQDLINERNRGRIVTHRGYVLAVAVFLILVAHLINARRVSRGHG